MAKPQQKANALNRLNKWQELSPAERKKIRKRYQSFQKLDPQQRKKLRRKYNQLTPEQKRKFKQRQLNRQYNKKNKRNH